MSNKLYITAIEDRSGKSLITMGIMEILLINIEKVAFFRPFIDVDPQNNQKDNDLVLISETFGLDIPYEDMYAFTVAEASHLASEGRQAEVLEEILNKFTRLEETYDFVLCEGTDFRGSTASFELDINAQIANHLGCPVILVGKAKNKTTDEAITAIEISVDAILKKGNNIIATFINRVPAGEESSIVKTLKKREFFKDQPVYAIPEVLFLNDPTMGEIIKLLDARVLYGEDQTDLPVHRYIVAAMQLRNFLDRIEYGSLVITPGDRADVIIATLSTVMSSTMPYISGIVLTGGLVPEESIHKLIKGFKRIVPILSVESDTFPAVRKIDTLNTVIMPGDSRKIALSLATFEEGVNMAELEDKIISSQTTIVTPIMFEYRLLQKARLFKQHIVLPEGDEPRILRATEILLHRSVVDITLLGDRGKIERNAAHLGLKIEGAAIIDPSSSDLLDDYMETYCELRKHKEITRDSARDIMMDVNFFGTMMVYKGHADGLVSGAVHTTADTIRPAFQFIKTRPGCSIVSSVMLMCLKDRVLVYGDCAVNPNPDSETLSEIAISSAATARLFKIEPRVAMLSYATGESGKGADVDTVREAVKLTEKKIAVSDPGLKIEGPIQYDAAVDSAVAKTKMPESEVAGKATVFIFPDLNTGNNTYKAVQRSAGAVAIGPVLQGLRKPVNDLSRGCLVNDIVNTVAITAVQAQEERLT